MPTARALTHADNANDTHAAKPAIASGNTARTRSKDAEEKARRRSHAASKPSSAAPPVTLTHVKEHASPLLIGAGLGAAVALSVVALRSRERTPTVALFASPNATFFSALVKTAAFAVERTATKGSFANLVARAVGKAVG
jgi:hypothetical protein